MPEEEAEKPVRRVGDYEFLDRLAVGGMGEVWRVRHVTLGAIYVAKVLRPEYRDDEQFLKRFLHEARLVANLRHPNIVQVFGYDAEHTLYLMEYVEGVDLDHLLRSKRILTFEEKRTIIEAVADTIGYAHREVDLIHRDIKPSNVLVAIKTLDEAIKHSSIKLTDFGIARLLSASQRVTMSSGMIMGTLHYMAPEQFEGDADKRSDVYATGVLYYQLLTGTIPFDGPTAFVIRDKHASEVPPAPHELNPDIPLADSVVVMRCLEKDPARRYQDAAQLYEALMGAQSPSQGIAATQVAARPAPTVATGQSGAQKPQTEETLLTAGAVRRATDAPGPPTAGTMAVATPTPRPTAATMTPVERETEPTLHVAAKPRRWRRVARTLLIAIVALAVLALVGTQLLKPRYELAWSTLRSDPLDTPNGIQVEVAPKVGFGRWWMSVGTVDEQAPANWANWTTWFGSIDVKLSDGLYRKVTITCQREACKQARPLPVYDFGGATFEQVAEAHHGEIVEDLSGVGKYVNAVLTPKGLATTYSLPDVRRCLVRVSGLLGRAEGFEFDRTRLDTYRAAVASLVQTAEALADGKCEEAESELGKADAAIAKIDLGGLAALPDDFLFRNTLRSAVAQLKARAARAERFLQDLEPVTGSSRDVDYTLSKYLAARGAVAQYILAAPGRAGYKTALGKLADGQADVAALLDDLGEAAPPPFRTARSYLAKLDLLLDHKPDARQERAFRVGVLNLLDTAAAAEPVVEAPAWAEKCFESGQLAPRAQLVAFWQRMHRSRFDKAAERCRQLARDGLKAIAAQSDPEAANRVLADVEASLDALRQARHESDDGKRTATGLLSSCCVRHAMLLFSIGPRTAAQEGEHLDAVRKLLDRGLDELGGCTADVEKQGRALREILKFIGEARAKLADCRRENLGDASSYGGRVETLFTALDAYERLARALAGHAGHPCAPAAIKPFVQLQSERSKGFTLPNAAACWLLGRSLEACAKGRYDEASGTLQRFLRVPGATEPQAESPLRRLLAKPLLEKADALARIASFFDDSKLAALKMPEAERWQKVWGKRLEALPHLNVEVPQKAEPGPDHKGQEAQWTAIYGLMRNLLDHYRARVQAEEALRRVEADARKLFVREGETVKANPKTATPEAIERSVKALEGLEDGADHKGDDHPARLAAMRRDLGTITTIRTGSKERILALIAKPDPVGALGRIAASRAVLGKDGELDLTRQAVAAWTKQADAEVAGGRYDAAFEKLKTMQQHEQVKRHAADQAVKRSVADVARRTVVAWKKLADGEIGAGKFDAALEKLKAIEQHGQVKGLAADQAVQQALGDLPAAVHYCEGQRLLAKGTDGLTAALPRFQQAGAYRDAESIVKQIGPFLAAAKVKDTAPFKAWARFDELSKSKELPPKVREAAATAARQLGESLVLAAVSCTRAFDQALVEGGWEAFIGRAANPQQELERIRGFLQQVEKLKIEQTEVVGRAQLLCDTRQVRVTTKRRMTFAYKLPGAKVLPVTLEQKLEWTVRRLPAAERKDKAWVIEAWEEAY